MGNLLLIIAACALLMCLLFYEKREGRSARLIVKVALSSLFIIAALTQPHPLQNYYRWLMMGLFFCLIGDTFLAITISPAFTIGLFAFLAGHIFFILAFGSLIPLGAWIDIQLLAVMSVTIWVFSWLRKYIGAMFLPVIFYMAVITLMSVGAFSVLRSKPDDISGGILVAAGAACFYISDVFVARDRFVRKEFLNRAIGLPLYYCGQFLLAFSLGFLK